MSVDRHAEDRALQAAEIYGFRTEAHGEGDAKFFTSPDFWECECIVNHIHTNMLKTCRKCHAVREESPDARLVDVILFEEEVLYDFPSV